MIAENAEDTKSQTPRVWGDQKTIQSGINSDRSGRTGQTSRETRGEQVSTDRNDWTRRDFVDQCGQGTPGGIVDRLIEKLLTLIEDSENRTAELRKQLLELKSLSQQIKQPEDQ